MINIGTRVRTSANWGSLTGTVINLDKDEFDQVWYEVEFDNTHEQLGCHGDQVGVQTGEFRENNLTALNNF